MTARRRRPSRRLTDSVRRTIEPTSLSRGLPKGPGRPNPCRSDARNDPPRARVLGAPAHAVPTTTRDRRAFQVGTGRRRDTSGRKAGPEKAVSRRHREVLTKLSNDLEPPVGGAPAALQARARVAKVSTHRDLTTFGLPRYSPDQGIPRVPNEALSTRRVENVNESLPLPHAPRGSSDRRRLLVAVAAPRWIVVSRSRFFP